MALTDPKRRRLFFSRSALVAVAAILGPAASPAPNSGGVLPTVTVRLYTPVSTATFDSFGDMRLSQNFASFSLLKGHMDLQFAGTMPDFFELKDPEIQVYRVVNAEEFFRMNGAAGGICRDAIKWLGVRLTPDIQHPLTEPAKGVRVAFFTISDYRDYTPRTFGGYCSFDSYELRRQ